MKVTGLARILLPRVAQARCELLYLVCVSRLSRAWAGSCIVLLFVSGAVGVNIYFSGEQCVL